LGVTGEDLLRDTEPMDGTLDVLLRLGFGPADVAVAVPECWFDVAAMADLDEISGEFHARHGRRLRVATKYLSLTRRFFAEKGVTGYRIIESSGATEGAPATGSAEIIVDITTTGATLKANHLKVLDDGVILKSEAVLAGRRGTAEDERVADLINRLAPHIRPRG
jgi:ATP phosphoribosyltransferase